MAIRLRVRSFAEARGLTISSLQRDAKIPMSTARRVWYSTSDGKEHGPPLKLVNLDLIEKLARFFEINAGDLLDQSDQEDS